MIILGLECAAGLSICVLPVPVALAIFVALPLVIIFLLRPIYAYWLGIILLPVWTINVTGQAQQTGEVDFRFADLAFLLAYLGLFVRLAYDKHVRIKGSAVDVALLLLFGWMAASCAWGVSPSASAIDIIKKTYGLGIMYLGVNLIDDEKKLDTTFKLWMLAGTIFAIIGLSQLITIGMHHAAIKVARGEIEHWGKGVRAMGFSETPNKYGFFLGTCLLVAFAYFGVVKRWTQKALILVAVLVMLISFTASLSRTTWVAFAIVAVTFLLPQRRTRTVFIVLGLLGAVAFIVISTGEYRQVLYERAYGILSPEETADYPMRLAAWQAAIRMFTETPIWGVGVGSYHQIAGQYGSVILAAPHNIFVYFLAEFGLVGTALFGYLLFSIARALYRTLKTVTDPDRRVIVFSLAAGLALYLLQSMIIAARLRENEMWAFLGMTLAALRVWQNGSGAGGAIESAAERRQRAQVGPALSPLCWRAQLAGATARESASLDMPAGCAAVQAMERRPWSRR